MRARLVLTSIVAAALCGAPALLGTAAAADVTVNAAGTTVFKVPGMGNCNSPTTINLKTSGSDFGFAALVQGGEGGANPCSLVNIHMTYSNKTPEQRTCQPTPVGPTGSVTAPATFKVVQTKATKTTKAQTQHVVESVIKDCSNGTVRMVNTMVLSASTVEYTFQQFYNGGLNLVATGTLTRLPTG